MSIEIMIRNVLHGLSDPLGAVVIVGSILFLYVLWVAIRDSGPRGPRKPAPSTAPRRGRV